jgi:hypothetical protein
MDFVSKPGDFELIEKTLFEGEYPQGLNRLVLP